MIVYFVMDATNCFCFNKVLRFRENFHGNKCREGRKMFQIL